jgi:hypothetical protein
VDCFAWTGPFFSTADLWSVCGQFVLFGSTHLDDLGVSCQEASIWINQYSEQSDFYQISPGKLLRLDFVDKKTHKYGLKPRKSKKSKQLQANFHFSPRLGVSKITGKSAKKGWSPRLNGRNDPQMGSFWWVYDGFYHITNIFGFMNSGMWLVVKKAEVSHEHRHKLWAKAKDLLRRTVNFICFRRILQTSHKLQVGELLDVISAWTQRML